MPVVLKSGDYHLGAILLTYTVFIGLYTQIKWIVNAFSIFEWEKTKNIDNKHIKNLKILVMGYN